ncbi:hypothetical protein [uncultured Brachyspira sp.]|uniref:hypothetical protein n=1 Tax=uncultured Brachyspira sp. TaxID=221953 RepID=UPI0025D0931E|nr:hypothetical protein [uncultured Brachyspira sp.]
MSLNGKKALIIALSFFVMSCGGLPTKDYERVTALRETVNKYTEIKTFAQNDYDIAEKGYAEADIIMKAENKDEAEKAKELLLTAETNYNLVLDKGLPPYSEILKKQTDENYTNASQIKANVMYGEEYAQAETIYNEANAMYTAETKDYRVLVDKLYTAKEAYLALYNKTKEQFDKSDEALTKVKERLAELEAMVKELETLEQEQQS